MDKKLLTRPKTLLLAGAVALAIGGAALGNPRPRAASPPPRAPGSIQPFDLARVLSTAPPDVVVLTLGDGRHPLMGAVPATWLGESEDAQVERAPRARRIILVGADAVRTDHLARRLLANERDVLVLDGGLEAWDRAMDTDPPLPKANAGADERARYARDVALRRYFGEAKGAPSVVQPVPRAAPAPGAAAPAKKREGC